MTPKKSAKQLNPLIESWWVPLALIIIGVVAIFFIPKPTNTNNENTGSANENVGAAPPLTISTADGINLAAEFHSPTTPEPWPAVILVHSFGQNRHQWDPYLAQLTSAGIAILAYDIRGFGQSPVMTRYADILKFSDTWPNDIPAVVDYLRQQSNIDPTRISVLGLGSGGLVALAAFGRDYGLYRAVVVEPDLASGLLPADTKVTTHPGGILFLTDQAAATATQVLYDRAAGPKDFQVLTANAGGLLSSETIWPTAISWISN